MSAPEGNDAFARYAVLERLGSGEPPSYAAFDRKLNRRIALRMLEDDPDTLDAARTRARLVHPNAVAVHEVGTQDGRPFMATDFAVGTSFAEWRRARVRAVVNVGIQIGAMLAEAHALGIVHGRLEAQHVVVDDDGRATVFGFGLFRSTGRAAVDPRVDQYALCALVRDALRRPAWLAPVIERGLATDPADRFESMSALVDALRRARSGAGFTIAAGAAVTGLALTTTVIAGWPEAGDCGRPPGNFDEYAARWHPDGPVDCSEVTRPEKNLGGFYGPPADRPGLHFEASIEIRNRLMDAQLSHDTGDMPGAIAKARQVIREAKTIDWGAMETRGRALLAEASIRIGDTDVGCPAAHTAYETARRIGDALTAGEAATTLAYCEGVVRNDDASGLLWARHAAALLERLDASTARTRALLHETLAQIHEAHGRPAEAEGERAEAKQLGRFSGVSPRR